jgi:ribosomal protein L11 methylase PrmA
MENAVSILLVELKSHYEPEPRVLEYLDDVAPRSVWDLGSNTGEYARLSSERGIPTTAFDVDPGAVEVCWRRVRERRETNLLPLVMDLTNPSPDLGWDQAERAGLTARGPADLVLCLALVHHLAIGNNVPLEKVASFLGRLGRSVVVEFVPKSDPQVRRMLATRTDVFPDYTREGFEKAFAREFTLQRSEPLPDSERRLYLYQRS